MGAAAVQIADAPAWDRALLALPNPHVLQSWAWGAFKARHGWRCSRLLFQEEGRTVAAASLLQRRLVGWPRGLPGWPRGLPGWPRGLPGWPRGATPTLLYVPKGPALDWADAGLAGRVLAALEQEARARKAMFVKVDPDLYDPDGAPAFSPRPACAPAAAGLLTARGWRFSDEQIQFRNTVLLDLRQSEEELLAAMKQKTRYNVQLARRRGVAVREGSAADLDTLYRLYAETARRDGFPIRPAGYYHDAWGSFLAAGQAHLLLAEVEGEAVAGLVLFTFGPTAWYMYGASADRHRPLMPNNLLQWEAIRRARAAGCTLYDLWGAPDRLDESDPMWGVVRFKLGLGGQVARGLGAWDYPVNRALYGLYSVVMPRYLGWLRARTQPGMPGEARLAGDAAKEGGGCLA